MENNKCPKCNGEFEEGHTVEFDGGIVPMKEKWGTSAKAGWSGAKIENKKTVTAYCCKSCGYLEQYAK